jgi:hypothetical protein
MIMFRNFGLRLFILDLNREIKENMEMLKKITLSFVVFVSIFSLSATLLFAQNNSSSEKDKQQQNQSPFLITTGLPHLTKLLIQQWDNPKLQLSDEQKAQLLIIRKETMSGVKSLAPQIMSLQKQVTQQIFEGKTPDELSPAVQAISKLKTEATMLHLKCIYSTSKILNQQQLERLLL